jgi:hypothetical protein
MAESSATSLLIAEVRRKRRGVFTNGESVRNLIFISLFLALPVEAQVTKPPDPLANLPLLSQAQANVQTDLLAYKGWVESQIAPGGTLDTATQQIATLNTSNTANTALIASLQGQITTLQAAIATQGAQIAMLQAQVAALSNPPPPPPPATTNLSLIGLPVGALSGTQAGIGWGTGLWNSTGQGVVAACATSAGVTCPARNFTLPANQTLLSVTFSCAVTCSLTFTDSVGETVQSGTVVAGNATTLQTSWSKTSGSVTMQMQNGPATAVTLTALSYN